MSWPSSVVGGLDVSFLGFYGLYDLGAKSLTFGSGREDS